MIPLTIKGTEITQDFEHGHAERLLAMPNNGGWVLPDNSPYEFENGKITKRNTKTNTGKAGGASAGQSD